MGKLIQEEQGILERELDKKRGRFVAPEKGL